MKLYNKIMNIETKEEFNDVLKAIAYKGKHFSPNNFIWDMLPYAASTELIFSDAQRKLRTSEIIPPLQLSLAKHGQILPVWVEPDGTIIDGEARYAILGSKTKYLIYPGFLDNEKKHQIRITNSFASQLKLLKEWGIELWTGKK